MKPEPQGSIRSFKNQVTGKLALTSTNKHLKPFRHTVTQVAMIEMSRANLELPMAAKHVPVELVLEFFFKKPESCPKNRVWPVVKPDIDKLERATLDALTGVLFADDAQVVRVVKEKVYGPIDKVHITARIIKEK
jgi:crossover junction endodeoxyribonuclease RusA